MKFIYYLLLIPYNYIYKIIANILYISEYLFRMKFDVERELTDSIGFYNNLAYYYIHAYQLILKIIGIKIYLINKILNKKVLWIYSPQTNFEFLIIQFLLFVNNNKLILIVDKSCSYIPFVSFFDQHSSHVFVYKGEKSLKLFLKKQQMKSHGSTINESFLLLNCNQHTIRMAKKNLSYDKIGEILIENDYLNSKSVCIDFIYKNKNDSYYDTCCGSDYMIKYNYSVKCMIFNSLIIYIFYYLITATMLRMLRNYCSGWKN